MNQSFRAMLARDNFVVVDTETTGLERPAEIVQIAVIGKHGDILLDTLIKPKMKIPLAATQVHGLTDEICQDAPIWPFIRPEFLNLIAGKDVIVYNATYDRKLMHWSDEMWEDVHIDYKQSASWHCAMEAYAEYHGERHPFYGSSRPQRLAVACQQMGVETADKLHSALADALATLMLCEACTKDLPIWRSGL